MSPTISTSVQPKSDALLLTDLEALEPLELQWRALAVARENPQMTPDFYKSWVRNYDQHVRPFVPVLFEEDGQLRGLLPLVITTDRLRHVQFAGAASFWMHAEPLAHPTDELELASAAARLIGARDEWGVLTLDNVDVKRPWVDEFVQALLACHDRTLRQDRVEQDWLVVDVAAGWDAYLAAKTSTFRQKLRRQERKLAEAHQISFRAPTSPDELQTSLKTLFSLHYARRDQLELSSTFDDSAMRRTLEDFAVAGFDHGWTRVRVLEVDGDVGAASLSFRVGDRSVGYLFGWDQKWESDGVGRFAMVDSFRAAAEEGAREFDLSVGWSDFKSRHATATRAVNTVWLYPRSTAIFFALRKTGRMILPVGLRRRLGSMIRSSASRVDMPR